jgi:hypothetical protein
MKPGWSIAKNNGEGVSERRDDLLIESKESRSGGTPSPDAGVPAKAKRRSFSGPEIAKILGDLDRLGRASAGPTCDSLAFTVARCQAGGGVSWPGEHQARPQGQRDQPAGQGRRGKGSPHP